MRSHSVVEVLEDFSRFVRLMCNLDFSGFPLQMPVNSDVMYPHLMEGFLPVSNLFIHL